MCCTQPAPDPEQPNIVILLVDTLRADHVGAYGYDRPTTPQIDALAERGVVYTQAQSTSSWTKPSVASLFTSRWPSEHGAVTMTASLDDSLPTLAELLQNAGYATVGVSGNFIHISPTRGFDRGFDRFVARSAPLPNDHPDVIWTEPLPDGKTQSFRTLEANEINSIIARQLHQVGDRPFLLYAHYMEPHSNYTPPAKQRLRFARPRSTSADATGGPSRKRVTSDDLVALARGELAPSSIHDDAIDLYDAEIADVDEAIGRIVNHIDALSSTRKTIYAIVSDHGEEFGEHGRYFHGITLHSESLHIPFVLVESKNTADAPLRIDAPVSLVDLAPTLLVAAGLTPPDEMQGRPLPLRTSEWTGQLPPLGLIAEQHADDAFEKHAVPREHRISVTHGSWKWIAKFDGEPEVYSHADDPRETRSLPNVPATRESLPESLKTSIEQWQARLTSSADENRGNVPAADSMTDAERAQLRALGYAD